LGIALVQPLTSAGPQLDPAQLKTQQMDIRTNPKDGLEYVLVPAATFEMGCVQTDDFCDRPERPRHTVKLTQAYMIGRTEVTVGAFDRFVRAKRHKTLAEKDGIGAGWTEGQGFGVLRGASWKNPGFPQGPDHPVVQVAWKDASAYCKWAGGRLPTEAEWENAARGGRAGEALPWSSRTSREAMGGAGRKHANYGHDLLGQERLPSFRSFDRDGWIRTAPVGSFPPNDYGLFDVAGNVSEWVSDRYSEEQYRGDEVDPTGPRRGKKRVFRNGSWVTPVNMLRLSQRSGVVPETRSNDLGFRCALPATTRTSRAQDPADESVATAHPPSERGGPSPKPIPRLELGMHHSPVWDVAADSTGRWAVSTSSDKTARVWDLVSGRLQTVLRPPLGAGPEGMGLAVAMTSDGRLVALGGHTGLEWDTTAAVYLFRRGDGVLVRRLEGLPSWVSDVAFSPDGRQLAVGVQEGGVRLFDTSTGKELARDEDYGKGQISLSFDSDGKLAACSGDGILRLYGKGLRLKKKTPLRGGERPLGLAFSPDGASIAVGYPDRAPALEILSGRDLRWIASHQIVGPHIGPLAWSPDSRTLYAGVLLDNGVHGIRRWSEKGRGPPIDTAVAGESITGLLALADGTLLYGSGRPEIGTLSPDGSVTRRSPVTADFRFNAISGLLIDRTGGIIRFGFSPDGSFPAEFSLRDLRLDVLPPPPRRTIERGRIAAQGPPSAQGLEGPRQRWTDWPRKVPRLQGEDFVFPGELQARRPTTFAIGPSEERLVMGFQGQLWGLDKNLKRQWVTPLPGPAWITTISGDGRLAVAALGDGTIRWYRLSDGVEQLALLPHSDRRRWVVWTPEGFFAASEGGEQLVGWHVNQGASREARFYSIEQFYDAFYRPDLVLRKFRGEDISRYSLGLNVEEALASPPPRVSILSPASGVSVIGGEVTLSIRIEDQGGGIGDIRVYHNGKLVESMGVYRLARAAGSEGSEPRTAAVASVSPGATRGVELRALKLEPQTRTPTLTSFTPLSGTIQRTYTVKLVTGENTLSATAFNGPNTVMSVLRTVSLSSSTPARRPALHVLSVGNGTFKSAALNLATPTSDARDLAETFRAAAAARFTSTSVRTLTDTTRGAFFAAIDEIVAAAKPEDTFVLFLASHGVARDGVYYVLTSDYDGGSDDPLTRISSPELVDISKRIPALEQVLVLDTCQAGGVEAAVAGLYDARVAVLGRSLGMHVLAASRTFEAAQDDYQGNGLFTHFLLKGLHGAADEDKNRQVAVTELAPFLVEAVRDVSGGRQQPSVRTFGKDFELTAVRQP
jgi:formylglycine-generating enzyme required for sulfatase activity/WD40 repeat protein